MILLIYAGSHGAAAGPGATAAPDPAASRPALRTRTPGELVHLDIKKLGRIGRFGHRIHGNRRTRVLGIGWEYLHVCIDDATRLAYGDVLDDECSETAIGFLRRATAWFASLDVRIERVLTDNGPAFRSHRFRAAVHAIGAQHLRTRPYMPRINRETERFIRTALEKWGLCARLSDFP